MLLEARTGSDPIRGSSSGCVRSTLYSLRAPPRTASRSLLLHSSFLSWSSVRKLFYLQFLVLRAYTVCTLFELVGSKSYISGFGSSKPMCKKKAPLKCFYTKELHNNATIYRSYIKQIYIYLLRLHFLTYFF